MTMNTNKTHATINDDRTSFTAHSQHNTHSMQHRRDFVTVLHSDKELRKTVRPAKEGLAISGFSGGTWFRATEHQISGLRDLHELLVILSEDIHACIIRGRQTHVSDELVRRRSNMQDNGEMPTFERASHHWIMLDFDCVTLRDDVADPIAEFIKNQFVPRCPEFADCSYVVDLGTRHGLRKERDVFVPDPTVGSFHIWYWLEQPADDLSLSPWAYSAGADSAMFRTVQPHYTSPPAFQDVDDHCARQPPQLVLGKRDTVPFSPLVVNSPNLHTEWVPRTNAKPMAEFVPNQNFADLYRGEQSGGRFYRYMLRVAMQALAQGFDPNSSEIEEFGLIMSHSVNPEKRRHGSHREAENALRQAHLNISSSTHVSVDQKSHVSKGITCEYISSECGSGKSKQALAEIARSKGNWVYACDTIDAIEERRREFVSQLTGVQQMHWKVEVAYSNCPAGGGINVAGQVHAIKKIFSNDRSKGKLLFVTHKALSSCDWSEWSDYHLICDEELDVIQTRSIYLDEIAELVLKKYITLMEADGVPIIDRENYIAKLTPDGKKLATLKEKSTVFPQIKELCEMISMKNGKTFVSKEVWDKTIRRDISFWSLVDSNAISYFASRLFMSDDFESSKLFNAWKINQNVNWRRREFVVERPPRVIPTSERTIVLYFSEDNASFSRFEDDDYASVANAIGWLASLQRPMLFATNERVYTKLKSKKIPLPKEAEYVTPIQRGRNDLAHHDFIVFISALNVNGQARNIFHDHLGMRYDDVLRAIQHQAAWQLCNRGCIRDWDASTTQTTVVWSKGEADYIAARFGCKAEQVRGADGKLVVDRVKKKNGRPKSNTRLSNAEKAKRYRERKKLLKSNESNFIEAHKLSEINHEEIRL